MANKAEIKKAILAVAGNPETGIVREYADRWAEAIVALDDETPHPSKEGSVAQEGTPFERAKKETRVTKPTEIR